MTTGSWLFAHPLVPNFSLKAGFPIERAPSHATPQSHFQSSPPGGPPRNRRVQAGFSFSRQPQGRGNRLLWVLEHEKITRKHLVLWPSGTDNRGKTSWQCPRLTVQAGVLRRGRSAKRGHLNKRSAMGYDWAHHRS